MLAPAEPSPHRGERRWLFQCDCGEQRILEEYRVVKGAVKSCGCIRSETNAARNFRHGKSGSKIHGIWKKMLERCYNPNNRAFPYYGGRGIKVQESWHEFKNFYADVGDKPDNLELDRINNDGDYSFENVRWTTRKVNCNNKSNNTVLQINGTSKTISEWAEACGLPPKTLAARNRRGFVGEDLLAPVGSFNAWTRSRNKAI